MKTPAALLRQIAIAATLLLQATSGAYATPACVKPGGIGGTGRPALEGGIGGTGAPLAGMPGGMGGTGAAGHGGIGGTGAPADGGVGGTGIVGTIIGFASICVNGLEVHYDDSVPLSENALAVTTERLAVGQVVAIEAYTSDRGLEARTISIVNAYEGPVTELPSGSTPLRVMGRPVHLAPDAHVDGDLQLGDAVRVSGLRNAQGEVVATRVERAPRGMEASAIGVADRRDALHGLALSGRHVVPGTEFLVRGRWSSGRLEVTSAVEDPSIPFAGRVRAAVVEGLVGRHDRRSVSIGGFAVDLGAATAFAGGNRHDLTEDRRIRIHGTFSGPRGIRAERVEFVHEFDGDAGNRPHGQAGPTRKQADRQGSSGTESENNRLRLETEAGPKRQRIERTIPNSDGIERERIEREIGNADGQPVLRERTEIKNSGDRSAIRERIEVYDGGKRIDRVETIERVDRPSKTERPERIDRSGREDRPERIDRSGRN